MKPTLALFALLAVIAAAHADGVTVTVATTGATPVTVTETLNAADTARVLAALAEKCTRPVARPVVSAGSPPLPPSAPRACTQQELIEDWATHLLNDTESTVQLSEGARALKQMVPSAGLAAVRSTAY